jgi:hypothetical protein
LQLQITKSYTAQLCIQKHTQRVQILLFDLFAQFPEHSNITQKDKHHPLSAQKFCFGQSELYEYENCAGYK